MSLTLAHPGGLAYLMYRQWLGLVSTEVGSEVD